MSDSVGHFTTDLSGLAACASHARNVSDVLLAVPQPEADVVALPQAGRFLAALKTANDQHFRAVQGLGRFYAGAADNFEGLRETVDSHDAHHAASFQ